MDHREHNFRHRHNPTNNQKHYRLAPFYTSLPYSHNILNLYRYMVHQLSYLHIRLNKRHFCHKHCKLGPSTLVRLNSGMASVTQSFFFPILFRACQLKISSFSFFQTALSNYMYPEKRYFLKKRKIWDEQRKLQSGLCYLSIPSGRDERLYLTYHPGFEKVSEEPKKSPSCFTQEGLQIHIDRLLAESAI